MTMPPPRSTLFPYTTLFRSVRIPARSRRQAMDWNLVLLSQAVETTIDRKSTRLNSSHSQISYAVFCLKKKRLGLERRFRHLRYRLPPAVSARLEGRPRPAPH